MKKLSVFCTFFIILLFFFLSSCRLYKLERQLDPENAEFLSKVRYIITKEERKIFLELPQEEREKFREEFWKRRDPDPDTEENELKIEYFNRMEMADEIFLGEGRPGWLTDRGRIYILFGPPTDRITYPAEAGRSSRCSEIWYYANFPVIFIDEYCDGVYDLATLDLSRLRDLNLAQTYIQRSFQKEKELFDFNWKIEKTLDKEDRVEGVIIIEVPYDVIWFKFEDEKLETILDIDMEIRDLNDDLIWEYQGSFTIITDEIELQQKWKDSYKIEIPYVLEEGLERLRQGKSLLHIQLENRTGGEVSKKALEFKLQS